MFGSPGCQTAVGGPQEGEGGDACTGEADLDRLGGGGAEVVGEGVERWRVEEVKGGRVGGWEISRARRMKS